MRDLDLKGDARMTTLSQTRRNASKLAGDVTDDLYEQIESALGYLNDLSEGLSKHGGRQMKRARHAAADAASDAEGAIRSNLGTSLIVALGVGLAIGFLLNRR